MATTYQIIRDKLRDKLLTETAIEEVARYPKREFTGYPAAILVPAEGDSGWETTAEHERAYVFDCQIFYETKGVGNDNALDALYNVVDEVLDNFAEDTLLEQGGAIALPAKQTIISVEPVSAGWEAMDDTDLLMARITIRVVVSVDIT
jgi:hypothetical protein